LLWAAAGAHITLRIVASLQADRRTAWARVIWLSLAVATGRSLCGHGVATTPFAEAASSYTLTPNLTPKRADASIPAGELDPIPSTV
jgi:hypothetical protein